MEEDGDVMYQSSARTTVYNANSKDNVQISFTAHVHASAGLLIMSKKSATLPHCPHIWPDLRCIFGRLL